MTGPDGGQAAAHAEIRRQHRFLQDWFAGTLPRTAEAFAPFAASTPPDFTFIDTSAARTSRPELLRQVESAHGAVPGLVIEVSEVSLIAAAGPLVIAGFTEVHVTADARTTRLVTAVLRHDPAAPGGLAWLHLHETAR
ncbi:hypothetical protein CLV63_104224 [Murinocardiopsis flavida]|uniref:DUF4440 domain-containing protein n=1 Tax=Murinocardiopsis flavida TaxID=645275 RepID=A0A2P8DP70_9ACTN|nr:hypothetical protein [Murinocardiopsis flavida]PSK99000.1 hypothetical protein CLV63_104224 [Murinocardiopsis flavida]